MLNFGMRMDHLTLLRLLHLADSALPIGAMTHSFGLETLAAEGTLAVEHLETFFADYLAETGVLEAAFCRAAHSLADGFSAENWLDLNRRLSARKPARESRAGSLAVGRRFLELARALTGSAVLAAAGGEVHHATAFGLVGSVLGVEEESTVLAYLHQSLAGLVSACQRLLPLGQSQAARMLWHLKPIMIDSALRSRDETACFTPLLDAAAMRHPALETRLFIS